MRYCPECALPLSRLRMRCPTCRRSTISWLHIAFIAALDVAGFIYVLRIF